MNNPRNPARSPKEIDHEVRSDDSRPDVLNVSTGSTQATTPDARNQSSLSVGDEQLPAVGDAAVRVVPRPNSDELNEQQFAAAMLAAALECVDLTLAAWVVQGARDGR